MTRRIFFREGVASRVHLASQDSMVIEDRRGSQGPRAQLDQLGDKENQGNRETQG